MTRTESDKTLKSSCLPTLSACNKPRVPLCELSPMLGESRGRGQGQDAFHMGILRILLLAGASFSTDRLCQLWSLCCIQIWCRPTLLGVDSECRVHAGGQATDSDRT